MILLIAAHVAKLRERSQGIHELGRPCIQFLDVRILQAVLVLRATHAILDREILHRLHEQVDTFDLRQFRLQAEAHLARADLPLDQGLQVDLDATAVERGVGAVHPDERGEAFYRRILQDHPGQGLLAGGHRHERDGLRRFGDPQDHSGVLDREEAFGYDDVEQHGQDQCSHGHHQRGGLVTQHPAQRRPVERDRPVEHLLGPAVERTLLLFRRVAKQPRAHHRREGQRHHGRDEDRHAEGDCKLPEQPSHHVLHEQQRN